MYLAQRILLVTKKKEKRKLLLNRVAVAFRSSMESKLDAIPSLRNDSHGMNSNNVSSLA